MAFVGAAECEKGNSSTLGAYAEMTTTTTTTPSARAVHEIGQMRRWQSAKVPIKKKQQQQQQQQLEVEVQKKDPRPEIETLSRGVNNIVSGSPRRVVREKAITHSLEMDACCSSSSLSVLPVGKPPHDMSTTRSHIFSILTQHAKSIIR